MRHDLKSKLASVLRFTTTVFGLSLILSNSSAHAQCASPGFKVADGFMQGSHSFSATATGDFNSDGKLDVAIANTDAGTVSTLFGDGLGKLGTATWYIVGQPQLDRVIILDINNDTKADIVVVGKASQFNVSVSVLINNGSGVFGSAVSTTVGEAFDVQFGDMNGDTKPDLVTTARVSGVTNLQVRLGNGTGQFTNPTNTPTDNLTGFLLGHLNGDTLIDFVAAVTVPPSNRILRQYLNNGVGGFSIGGTTDLGTSSTTLGAAKDLNADGKLDVAGSGPGTSISVFLNDGTGTFTRADYPSVDGRFLLADFDGNGASDFLSYTLGTGTWPYVGFNCSLNLNNGSGVLTRTDYKGLPVYTSFIAADFNNDGKADLLSPAYAKALFQWTSQVRINTCNYSLSTKRVDYDGDGVTDFAVWRPSTGEWSILQTDSASVRTQQWGLGSLGDVPVPGDYDGDGKTDIAVFRAPTGDWYAFRSSDSSVMAVHWGAAGDKPVPGDYDADGKTDVAVFRPSEGGWFILRSSDSTVSVAFFGTTGDKPVQADYDNDDKADVAVYRPSNGYWYILKSSDGSVSYINFGISVDKPLPGDYDGDGKADIAVFRPGEAWYILRSGTNTFIGAVWHQDLRPAPGVFGQTGSIINIDAWDSNTGKFYVYADNNMYSVGGSGDIPVTTPYVIE